MLETILKSGETAERCGLLLKDGTIVEITNVAADPEQGYEMDAAEALPHIKSGAIEATWHTHPQTDPTLSEDDRVGFLMWPDLEHAIIGIRDGDVKVMRYRVEHGLVLVCS